MNVEQFFESLSFGELSNLKIGMEGAGSIDPVSQSKVAKFTNHALTQIHSRLPHNRNYVKIRLMETRKKYPLTILHAASDTDVGNTADRFIIDTVEDPFAGNLLKILSVKEPDDPTTTLVDETKQLTLNDRGSELSVETLRYDTLYFAEPEQDKELLVEYQYKHTPISVGTIVLSEEIDIAPVLEEALELKVAARIYSTMNGEENTAKAARLNQEFESAIALVKQNDLLQLSSSEAHSKLIDRGFV